MIILQLEQGLRIIPPDRTIHIFPTNRLLDLRHLPIPPSGAPLDRLVGVVNAKQYPVGADRVDDGLQRRGAEVPAGGDPDVYA